MFVEPGRSASASAGSALAAEARANSAVVGVHATSTSVCQVTPGRRPPFGTRSDRTALRTAARMSTSRAANGGARKVTRRRPAGALARRRISVGSDGLGVLVGDRTRNRYRTRARWHRPAGGRHPARSTRRRRASEPAGGGSQAEAGRRRDAQREQWTVLLPVVRRPEWGDRPRPANAPARRRIDHLGEMAATCAACARSGCVSSQNHTAHGTQPEPSN